MTGFARRRGACLPASLPRARGPWAPALAVVIMMVVSLTLWGGRSAVAAVPTGPGVAVTATIGTLQTPDGGSLRYAWWPVAAPRGTVVMLPGWGEFLEKYQEIAEDWVGRGYQVFALDRRGQGLSSRFLADRHKGYVSDYAVHVADLALWLESVVKPHEVGPTILFAHSMGGLVGLRFLLDHPDRFAAVILSSPMVDLVTDPWPRFLAEMAARMAVAFGFSEGYAFGQHDYDPTVDGIFEGNPLTGDRVRFQRLHDAYRTNPDLVVGGVTFGWLVASFRAQAVVAIPGALQDVRVPVLLLIADRDRLVPAATQEMLCRRLHDCTPWHDSEAGHEILAERDEIRSRAWLVIDGFLTRVLVGSGHP